MYTLSLEDRKGRRSRKKLVCGWDAAVPMPSWFGTINHECLAVLGANIELVIRHTSAMQICWHSSPCSKPLWFPRPRHKLFGPAVAGHASAPSHIRLVPCIVHCQQKIYDDHDERHIVFGDGLSRRAFVLSLIGSQPCVKKGQCFREDLH